MKKFIILLVVTLLFFLIMAVVAKAEFFGSGEFGYCLEGEDYYAELEIGYRFHPGPLELELYAGAAYMMLHGDVFFSPYRGLYKAGSTLRFGHVYLNIEHICVHAIHSSDEIFDKYFVDPDHDRTRIGIGFEF